MDPVWGRRGVANSGKQPSSSLAAEWEAPRLVLERIVTRHGSFRGLGTSLGRSTMFLWRQLRQNKGFNLIATGKVLNHIGVPARFFYEEVLEFAPQYDAAWVLEHFRENGDLPRDPFLAAGHSRFTRLLDLAATGSCRRARRHEIETLAERPLFERRKTKAELEKLGWQLLLSAEAAAAGDRGLEKGQLADCGHLLLVWGAIQQARGHRDDSVDAQVLGYRLALAAGDTKVQGTFLCSAAALLSELGQAAAGLRCAEQASRLFQRQRDRGLLAQALLRISLSLSDLGRHEESRAEALAALRFADRGEGRTRASAWLHLGHLAALRGQLRKALAAMIRAKKYASGRDDLGVYASWKEGVLLGQLGRPAAAGATLRAALRLFEKRQEPRKAAQVAVDLAEMLIRAGRKNEAQETVQSLTPCFEKFGSQSQALARWLDLLALLLQGAWGSCLEHVASVRSALKNVDLRLRVEAS